MEVHVESTGALTRSLHVKIPAEKFEREVEARLKQMASRARVPGFRPGKAPMKVIQQQYGDSARMDAISELLRSSYPDAVTQAGVEPAGMPRFEIESQAPDQPLAYVAHFDVYPEIKLDKLDALAVERPQVEITEADVDKLVENLRKSRREWQPVARAAATGDQCTVDFVGRIDGEPFNGGQGADVSVELGAGQFLPDLERAIVGHAEGDVFTADVTFPEDYQREDLRGKTAQFEVTVKSVKAAQWPDIDAAFLTAHGVDENAGVAGLREKCRAALETERDRNIRNRLKQAVLDQLLKAHPLEVPPSRVAEEVERLRAEAAQRMGLDRMGKKLDAQRLAQMLPAELFEPRAKHRVALGLLVSEFIRERNIKVDPARVDVTLDGLAADYEHPEELRRYYQTNAEAMRGLENAVLEDQVVDQLLEHARQTDQVMSLDDLLKSGNQPAA